MLSLLSGGERRTKMQANTYNPELPVDITLFDRRNIYVVGQSHEDIPYLLNFGLEDRLMVGTDYTHADQSSEIQALDFMEQRALNGDFSLATYHKMVEDNPRRFYGL
jgi:predicted TIM-barrel fold metal-dependent hydrolase